MDKAVSLLLRMLYGKDVTKVDTALALVDDYVASKIQ